MAERRADRKTGDDLRPTVIYVHGLNNKPELAVLKRDWDMALFRCDMGAATRMAYWADLLYDEPVPREPGTQRSGPLGSRPVPLAIRTPGLPEVELTPLAAEGLDLGGARDFIARASEEMKLTGAGRGGLRAAIVPGRRLRDTVTRLLAGRFLKDAAAYFYNPAMRGMIQSRLLRLLVPGGGPYVVIGHSMGSFIAYDVLCALEAAGGMDVPLFLTLGSPLGLQEVQDHISQPLRVPRTVRRWVNMADPRDVVSWADPRIANDFRPKGTIRDVPVENLDGAGDLGVGSASHSITGYLRTREVQEEVHAAMGRGFSPQQMPRVAVARDLAIEVDERTDQEVFPVLIEVHEDRSKPVPDLAEARATLHQELLGLLRARDPKRRDPEAQIDVLERYISADLTPAEIQIIAGRHRGMRVHRLWRNSLKRALVRQAAMTLQVEPARRGYDALGSGITWAVLDTGVQSDHPHFNHGQPRPLRTLQAMYDCTQTGKAPVEVPSMQDRDGHGTHVAGIIAGRLPRPEELKRAQRVKMREEIEGFQGMAPEAKLVVYKVLDNGGSGRDSWIIKALDHIAATNERASRLVIHGVNLSLGGPFDDETFACGHSPLCDELRRLWRQGVIVCLAAGNEGRIRVLSEGSEVSIGLDLSIGDPANLEEAIAVGSTHREHPGKYGVSHFSSRGPTQDGRSKPDVVAPGERILSCNSRWQKGELYVEMSGTSMACPTVSGLLAGFLSVRRGLIGAPDQVKSILKSRCTDLGRDRDFQGAGLPNLVRMLLET